MLANIISAIFYGILLGKFLFFTVTQMTEKARFKQQLKELGQLAEVLKVVNKRLGNDEK